MMKLPWHSRSKHQGGATATPSASFESHIVITSRIMPGVTFRIVKMSFAKRLDLMQRVRELARRIEFLGAGQHPADKMDAALLQAEIEQVYVTWGVRAVDGLTVDGVAAGPEMLAAGPEEVFREALAAVRNEIGLNEEDRKNS